MRRASPLYLDLSYVSEKVHLGGGGRCLGLLNECGDVVGDALGGQRIDCNIHTRGTFGEQYPSS